MYAIRSYYDRRLGARPRQRDGRRCPRRAGKGRRLIQEPLLRAMCYGPSARRRGLFCGVSGGVLQRLSVWSSAASLRWADVSGPLIAASLGLTGLSRNILFAPAVAKGGPLHLRALRTYLLGVRRPCFAILVRCCDSPVGRQCQLRRHVNGGDRGRKAA